MVLLLEYNIFVLFPPLPSALTLFSFKQRVKKRHVSGLRSCPGSIERELWEIRQPVISFFIALWYCVSTEFDGQNMNMALSPGQQSKLRIESF